MMASRDGLAVKVFSSAYRIALDHSRAVLYRKVNDRILTLFPNLLNQLGHAARRTIVHCVVQRYDPIVRNERAVQIPVELDPFIMMVRINMKVIYLDVIWQKVFIKHF